MHRTVAHVVLRWGEPSQTFVTDGIRAVDALGWVSWVTTLSREPDRAFAYPPPERVVEARRPPVTARIANRMRRTHPWERAGSWLRPEVERVDPVLVHAHFGPAAAAAAAALRGSALPLVASFHGFDVTLLPADPRVGALYRRAFTRIDAAIVPSEFLAGRLRQVGFDGRLEIIPAGLRLDELEPGREEDEGPLRLVFVGRQAPVKGLDVLLRALPEVIREVGEVRLEVAGGGQDAQANAALAETLGVARHVSFRGPVRHDAALELLRRADIAVVPSRRTADGQEESSSLVAREALALGTQLVATATGGIADNLPPERRGELVPDGDPHALATAILELHTARRTWPERAQAARRWVEERFDSRMLARRLANLYEDLT